MASVDHVIIAVSDLAASCALLLDRLGLAAYAGGRMSGIGTESYIVPLGTGYLELIAVSEEREAVANPLGRAVQAAVSGQAAGFLAWAVEPGEELQPKAERHGLAAHTMKRALPDGGDVTCRVAGLQQAIDTPPLPYFVEWQDRAERPDQVIVDHAVEPTGFAWVELSGDEAQLAGWLDGAALPLQWQDGKPGIQAVGIVTDGEPIVLREPLDLAALPPLRARRPDGGSRAESPAGPSDGVAGGGADSEGAAAASPRGVFEAVLGRVETAIESAARVVEGVAGDVLSPRAKPPGSSEATS